MARSGSFGSSVNPFGTGNFGGLAQYDIGENLKDLAAYQAELAWGNGTLSDAEYQASLQSLLAAADPGTQAYYSAQNKLRDVTYRIGRSQAEAQGLDALIAFDQQALAGMTPSNVAYRGLEATIKNLQDSLAAELAQRRSRDYGKLVDDYNEGKTSTESLLAWVENTLASLPGDAPDLDNWESVRSSLGERLMNEKDAQVYQDYQERKISPADFLSYLTGRRDAYDPSSPNWDEADRRLRDAQKNVTDTALAAEDARVFNLYAEGKLSDNTYLVYIRKRIDKMAPDDPNLPEWKHRLTMAAHSLAEDALRHEVKTATSAAGEATAVKNLRSFYQAYIKTLNPGSAEYRQTEEYILALKPAPVATGGGGGGGGGKGGGKATGGGPLLVPKDLPKVIPSTGSFDAVMSLLTPRASDPNQKTVVSYLRLNLGSATDAENDKVWLYHDPRYPGQMVTARNPDGTIAKDENGKPFKVPGSSYRATSSDEIAAMQFATAVYSYGLAEKALANGDRKGYADALWHANNALDRVRSTQSHAVQVNVTAQLKALDAGIDYYTKYGDHAAVLALLFAKKNAIEVAQGDATLDQAQRDRLDAKADEVEDHPLFPLKETDLNGNDVLGPDGNPLIAKGWARMDAQGNVWLTAGTHWMLDLPTVGKERGWVNEDPGLGTWGMDHVQVLTTGGGQALPGEVSIRKAASSTVWVKTDKGVLGIKVNVPVRYVSYKDDEGNRVRGYSTDGQTWVLATGGVIPELVLPGDYVYFEDPATGQPGLYTLDEKGNKIPAASLVNGAWELNPELLAGANFVGVGAVLAGQHYSGEDVGAAGQNFRVVTGFPDENGMMTLNFIPTYYFLDREKGAIAQGQKPRGIQIIEPTSSTAPRGYLDEKGRKRAAYVRPKTIAETAAITRGQIPKGVQIVEEAYDAGVLMSSSWGHGSDATGIVSFGASMPAAVSPPTYLPVVYGPTPETYGVISLPVVTASPTYVPLPTLAPLPAPVLKTPTAPLPPKVTPAAKPVGTSIPSTQRPIGVKIVEPVVATTPKKTPLQTPTSLPTPTKKVQF